MYIYQQYTLDRQFSMHKLLFSSISINANLVSSIVHWYLKMCTYIFHQSNIHTFNNSATQLYIRLKFVFVYKYTGKKRRKTRLYYIIRHEYRFVLAEKVIFPKCEWHFLQTQFLILFRMASVYTMFSFGVLFRIHIYICAVLYCILYEYNICTVQKLFRPYFEYRHFQLILYIVWSHETYKVSRFFSCFGFPSFGS